MARRSVPWGAVPSTEADGGALRLPEGDLGYGDDWPRIETAWTAFPAVSMDARPDGVRLTAEMADVERGDVAVEIDGDLLVISWSGDAAAGRRGRRRHGCASATEVRHRTIPIPGAIAAARARAALRDGLLIVDVPARRAGGRGRAAAAVPC